MHTGARPWCRVVEFDEDELTCHRSPEGAGGESNGEPVVMGGWIGRWAGRSVTVGMDFFLAYPRWSLTRPAEEEAGRREGQRGELSEEEESGGFEVTRFRMSRISFFF